MDDLKPPAIDFPALTPEQREHLYGAATALGEQFGGHYVAANRVVIADALTLTQPYQHGVIIDVVALHHGTMEPNEAFDRKNHVGRVASYWCPDAECARRVLAKLHDQFTAVIYDAA